ncbi:hypothetical protein V2J09_018937 [Rumex salicifolius]
MTESFSKQIGGRMSWLFRTAVHKANLNRIRDYADSVVQQAGQAVVVGSKLFQPHTDIENLQSFQHTVKRLEELAVSSTGEERVAMLRRWLDSIREVEAAKNSLVDADDRNEEAEESMQPNLVLYQDTDHGGEPLTFLDVFLHSEALEGIGLSMILEAPNDEETVLVLEIFGHCLMGGMKVHQAILSSIQDLAKVFSCYQDEALMRRDELLRFARSSISGLKINANQARIDVEVTSLKTELMKEIKIPSYEDHEKSSQELDAVRAQAVKEALSQVRLYSKLKALLLQKKDEHHGDSPQAHDEKVDKLKILQQSLTNTTSKIEKRIENNRSFESAFL